MQQFQQDIALRNRERRFDRAFMFATAIEAKLYCDTGKSKRVVLGTSEKLIQHWAENEKQRVKNFNGFVECDKFFEREDRLFGNHEMWALAACKLAQPFAFRTEAHHKINLWKSGEIAERVKTP